MNVRYYVSDNVDGVIIVIKGHYIVNEGSNQCITNENSMSKCFKTNKIAGIFGLNIALKFSYRLGTFSHSSCNQIMGAYTTLTQTVILALCISDHLSQFP